MKICAFTGHRNLYGYSFDRCLLDRVNEHLIKNGVDTFLCGMAVGFDTECAQSVLTLKEKYDVKLVACLPCANQSDTFSQKNKLIYNTILEKCDEVITLAPVYRSGCMHARDRYMVDNSDVLVCFLRKNFGGTFYTVNYAKKLGKKIIEL